MLNEHGHVAEGSGENIFVVRNGVLMTPPPSDGVLEGITRDIVMDDRRRAMGIDVCRSAPCRAATSSSPTSSSSPARPPRSCRSARSTTTSSASPARSRAACRSGSRAITDGRDEEFARLHGVRRSERAERRSGGPDDARYSCTTPRCATARSTRACRVSVDDKVRIALKLDELGIALHRGRLPGLEPQGDRVLPRAWSASGSRTRSSSPSA